MNKYKPAILVLILLTFPIVGYSSPLPDVEYGERLATGELIDIKMIDGDLKFTFLDEKGGTVSNYEWGKDYQVVIDDSLDYVTVEYEVPYREITVREIFSDKVLSSETKENHSIDSATPIFIKMNRQHYYEIYGEPDLPIEGAED